MINISFNQAYDIVVNNILPLPDETVSVEKSLRRATSQDIISLIDSPSADVSLKDGYAVISEEIDNASPENPVFLDLIGSQFAGGEDSDNLRVTKGKAVKITSGAVIPSGVDGVLANEFAEESNNRVKTLATVGNNILRKGTDISKGEVVVPKSTTLMPTQIGLIAAAGHSQIKVYKKPRVAIIATGDEIVEVGKPVEDGKIAASNIATLAAWCNYFNMDSSTIVVADSTEAITQAAQQALAVSDCIITSGGAWRSERDFVVKVFEKIGWVRMFYRVKIGPGKAVAFGLLEGKPIFCLPGGPPSNQMAFLQLALPGLRCLGGHKEHTLPVVTAVLEKEVSGQKDWTQFEMGFFRKNNNSLMFTPKKLPSRLQSLSTAEGIITIPEGTKTIPANSKVDIQVLAEPSSVFIKEWV